MTTRPDFKRSLSCCHVVTSMNTESHLFTPQQRPEKCQTAMSNQSLAYSSAELVYLYFISVSSYTDILQSAAAGLLGVKRPRSVLITWYRLDVSIFSRQLSSRDGCTSIIALQTCCCSNEGDSLSTDNKNLPSTNPSIISVRPTGECE